MKTHKVGTLLAKMAVIASLALLLPLVLPFQPAYAAAVLQPIQGVASDGASASVGGLNPSANSTAGGGSLTITGPMTFAVDSATNSVTVGYSFSAYFFEPYLDAGQSYKVSVSLDDYLWASLSGVNLTSLALTSTLTNGSTTKSVTATYLSTSDPSVAVPLSSAALEAKASTIETLLAPTTGSYEFTQTLQATFSNAAGATIYIDAPDTTKVSSVPLPGALLLFGPALFGLAAIRKRFTK